MGTAEPLGLSGVVDFIGYAKVWYEDHYKWRCPSIFLSAQCLRYNN